MLVVPIEERNRLAIGNQGMIIERIQYGLKADEEA